jgi:coniferyl-aldehyde dehydrogenase
VLRAEGDVACPPAVVLDPPPTGKIAEEEIFGPVLPIMGYDDPEDVIAAEAGTTPLAAYVFDADADRARAFLRRLRSGGGAVNATILHLVSDALPFGGIGESGHGAYHGRAGFDTFTHARGVFTPARGPWLKALLPPYPRAARALFRRMAR